jgi:DNA polymerase-1
VLEFSAIKAFAEMELTGVVIDKGKWRTHLAIARQKRNTVETKLRKALTPVSSQLSVFGECTINLNSPKQLLKALNDLGLKVEATGEDALKRERHIVIDWLLEWRGWNTILERYGESLLDMINPVTGRIHTDFFQIGAASGRSASGKPNIQNIPRYDPSDPNSLDLRSCFVVPAGKKMTVADYSQQELRCLAELSLDNNLMYAYLHDEDLHTKTASYIYGVDKDKVSKAQRQTAKTINFAVSYGANKFRVADELKIEVDDAERIVNNYFQAYPGVRTYLQYTNNFAIQHGYTVNVDNRRRYFSIPTLDDPDYKKKMGSINREAGNTRIQGSCASVTRRALVLFLDKCEKEGLEVELALVVHDEIACYNDASISNRVVKVLEDSMKEAWTYYFKKIPMKVDGVSSDTWKH